MKKILALALMLLAPLAALAADTLGKTAVKTGAKNDVQVQLTDQGGTNLANILANNSTPAGAGTGGIQILSGNVQSAAPTYTSGNIAMPWLDTGGRAVVATNGTSLSSNLAQVNGSALSASNPVISQLSDGAATYTAAKTGQFPSALGQTTMASSLSVAIASNQSTLNVAQGAPTGAGSAMSAASNIAAAGTTAIVCKGSLAASQATKLYQVVVTGAANARCTIRFNDNSTMTNFASVETTATNPNAVFTCPAGFCGLTTSSTVTTLQYEANCTNNDSYAQDFTCSIAYCQAASGC